MARWTIGWMVMAGWLMALGCDHPVHIKNVRPQVTHIGPVQPNALTPDGRTVTEIVLYVQDYERDPVDVLLEYAGSDGEFREILQAEGGHNLVGLSSLREYPGEPHVIYWDTAGELPAVPSPVTLRATPTDLSAGTGPAYQRTLTCDWQVDPGSAVVCTSPE